MSFLNLNLINRIYKLLYIKVCVLKPCKKSFDRFRNLLIILSRLCYTFIHNMIGLLLCIRGNVCIRVVITSRMRGIGYDKKLLHIA